MHFPFVLYLEPFAQEIVCYFFPEAAASHDSKEMFSSEGPGKMCPRHTFLKTANGM